MWAPQTVIRQRLPPPTVFAEEGKARNIHLLLLKVNKETEFGPRELRYIWKE